MNVRAQTQNVFLIIDFIWLIRSGMSWLTFFPPSILVKYGLVAAAGIDQELVSRTRTGVLGDRSLTRKRCKSQHFRSKYVTHATSLSHWVL